MKRKRNPETDILKIKLKRQRILSNVSLAVSIISLAVAILVILLKNR